MFIYAGEAQKKFGNAKSISSAQFHGSQDQVKAAEGFGVIHGHFKKTANVSDWCGL